MNKKITSDKSTEEEVVESMEEIGDPVLGEAATDAVVERILGVGGKVGRIEEVQIGNLVLPEETIVVVAKVVDATVE